MPLARVSQFRNRANIGLLALAFGVILITSFVSVKSIDELRTSISWISHTVQVKDRLSTLQNAMGVDDDQFGNPAYNNGELPGLRA